MVPGRSARVAGEPRCGWGVGLFRSQLPFVPVELPGKRYAVTVDQSRRPPLIVGRYASSALTDTRPCLSDGVPSIFLAGSDCAMETVVEGSMTKACVQT